MLESAEVFRLAGRHGSGVEAIAKSALPTLSISSERRKAGIKHEPTMVAINKMSVVVSGAVVPTERR